MGNVDLLPQEKETVLQSLPQVGAVSASILHVTAYFNQEEDIGEEDQVLLSCLFD